MALWGGGGGGVQMQKKALRASAEQRLKTLAGRKVCFLITEQQPVATCICSPRPHPHPHHAARGPTRPATPCHLQRPFGRPLQRQLGVLPLALSTGPLTSLGEAVRRRPGPRCCCYCSA